MDFNAVVDVAIGLTVVYLGASLFVTVLHEYIAYIGKLRGRQLARDLARLIRDKEVKDQLARMPAFAGLFAKDGRRSTSYVDSVLLAAQIAGLTESPAHEAADPTPLHPVP